MLIDCKSLTCAGAHCRVREGDLDRGSCLAAAQRILQERLQGGGPGTRVRGDCIAERRARLHMCERVTLTGASIADAYDLRAVSNATHGDYIVLCQSQVERSRSRGKHSLAPGAGVLTGTATAAGGLCVRGQEYLQWQIDACMFATVHSNSLLAVRLVVQEHTQMR